MTPAAISWMNLVRSEFAAELRTDVPAKAPSDMVDTLTWSALRAHEPPGNENFLTRYYNLLRWTFTQDDQPEACHALAHAFYNRLLMSKYAKHAIVDWVDWGDVTRLSRHIAMEPLFTDTETFARNQDIWKQRWARNQRLPAPRALGSPWK